MRKPNILHIVNNLRVTASAIDQLLAHNLDKYNVAVMSYLEKDVPGNIRLPERIRVYPFGGSYSPIHALRFYRFLKEERIDILHTHHTYSSAVARVVSKFARVRTLHEDGGGHPSYSIPSQLLNTATFWMGDMIVCVSGFVYDSFNAIEKRTVRKDRVRIVPYGVNADAIRSKQFDRGSFYAKHCIPEGAFVISHTARLTPVKDEPYILRLVAELVTQDERIRLIIAGDGEMRQELEVLARDLGIRDKVIFTGLVTREEIYEILHFSDMFMMMSDSEGMSVSLIEALTLGLPCVLSDIPSFRETLAGADAGLFIDKKRRITENAAAIMALIQSKSRLEQCRQSALALALEQYDMKRCIKRYEALYDELLN